MFAGFYMFYAFTHDAWWYLRFVLPAFPPLIVGSLLVAKKISATTQCVRWHRHATMGWAIAVALVLAWSLAWDRRLRALESGRDQSNYAEAAAWARTHLPSGAVLVAMQTSGAMYYYTDFQILRWDQLQRRHLRTLERIAADPERPLVAVLFAYEQEETLRQRLAGPWEKIHANRDVTFWRRVSPSRALP